MPAAAARVVVAVHLAAVATVVAVVAAQTVDVVTDGTRADVTLSAAWFHAFLAGLAGACVGLVLAPALPQQRLRRIVVRTTVLVLLCLALRPLAAD